MRWLTMRFILKLAFQIMLFLFTGESGGHDLMGRNGKIITYVL
jgi:hypothetical protein